ncbi:MAG: hypothetical protein WCR92_09165 [Candidatus Cloacimonadaceae bacterium]
MKANVEVKFLNHAQERVTERALSHEVITTLCQTAAPMLKIGVPLRFKVGETTIVAQKRSPRTVEVITAWQLA